MLFQDSASRPASAEHCESPTAHARVVENTTAVSLSMLLLVLSAKRVAINANKPNYEKVGKLLKLRIKKKPCLPAGRNPPNITFIRFS